MLISGRSWILIQCNLHVISGLVLNKLRYFVVSLLDINRLALVCRNPRKDTYCIEKIRKNNDMLLRKRQAFTLMGGNLVKTCFMMN